MLQIMPVFYVGHDEYVFLYFAPDQIENRSVLLLCLHHVAFDSSHVIVYFRS